MDQTITDIPDSEPILTERSCGGWLATAPRRSPFRIGVTGATKQEARERFRRTIREWAKTLSAET